MKKRLFIIISSVILGYYLIGFPLTIVGVVNEWPLFPGGLTLKYQGKDNSEYKDEIIIADNDGPYVFYKADSLEIARIVAKDSITIPVFDSFHKNDKASVSINCNFRDNPEWNFKTSLKDTLVNEATNYSGVKRIMVISDIEGNFKAFRELLIANGVMDSLYRWTFSEGHLVLLGDFFDRGLNVTECLWLVYHLENEAKMKGGYVHFILGNHEIMNMADDFRYVRRKYTANEDLIGRPYKEFYKPDSELGGWLSTKNIVEKINETIFVHGGISEAVLEMKINLEEINRLSRSCYFNSKEDVREKSQNLKTLFDTKDSPFWNRDYVNQNIDESFIDKVLNSFKAREVVIGHTIVDNLKTFYSGKVIAVDTQHADGNSQGLLIDEGQYFMVDSNGQRNSVK